MLATKKETFVNDGLPFIKAIAPQILMLFGCCLYVGLGLFCAAILGVLSINQENAPRVICCYTFLYFAGLAGLIIAEYRSKKNRHFIPYILLTTPVNLIIVLFYNPSALFNFFDRLFPQAVLLTACALVFYIADYKPDFQKKHTRRNKKISDF